MMLDHKLGPPEAAERGVASDSRKTLSREAWIAAARKVLERHGIAHLKIDALARQLKVTRGSFYFHFANLSDLHDSLVEEWRTCNCRPFLALEAVEAGRGLFDRTIDVWITENPFSPALDLAVRDWARSARPLQREVEQADDQRISLLTRAFHAMGFDADEGLIRARITYLHQIGYYAIAFKEPVSERRRYRPIYTRIMLGESDAG